jgi:spore cortex biosynthesis protein YabQ
MGLMLGSGCLMGFMLDLYRVLKARFHLRGWVVSLIDLLYWAVAGGMVFGLLFWSNWGELRFSVLIAIGAGWFTYYVWFSDWAIRMFRVLLTWVEVLCRWTLRILSVCLWYPVVTLWMVLVRLITGMARVLWALVYFPLRMLSPLFRWLQPLRKGLIRGAQPVIRPLRRLKNRLLRWFPGQRNGGD